LAREIPGAGGANGRGAQSCAAKDAPAHQASGLFAREKEFFDWQLFTLSDIIRSPELCAPDSLKSPRAQMKSSEIRTFSVMRGNSLRSLLLYLFPKALLGESSK
jgi:hypothetical protein